MKTPFKNAGLMIGPHCLAAASSGWDKVKAVSSTANITVPLQNYAVIDVSSSIATGASVWSVALNGANQMAYGFPPGDNGFSAPHTTQTLPQNSIIDRYGNPDGGFLAPAGTPSWARSLRPGTKELGLRRYKIMRDLNVNSGRSAPWYAQPGGGIQYQLQNGKTVEDLLLDGTLQEL